MTVKRPIFQSRLYSYHRSCTSKTFHCPSGTFSATITPVITPEPLHTLITIMARHLPMDLKQRRTGPVVIVRLARSAFGRTAVRCATIRAPRAAAPSIRCFSKFEAPYMNEGATPSTTQYNPTHISELCKARSRIARRASTMTTSNRSPQT
ncbi:hypothetical protein EJ02DRAFT_204658 [Clathrospora elynae]|uniref:Uncharacterized protein n=1 Tax=Clathrospora elynae TaxID=706981 RepID=A0A6A5SL90_9PLEO|nr:hypothetical protein EJ02DRAFT_204658 [Clathrospora elynae]